MCETMRRAAAQRRRTVERNPAIVDVRPALTPSVRAAGGIVWRPAPVRGRDILLVHRPAYDDWTFPKGKLRPDEDEAGGALREVLEETGMHCRLGRALGATSYVDRRGRPKIVYYWLMRALGGSFSPSIEVDDVEWMSAGAAFDRLTYNRDRVLLAALPSPAQLARRIPEMAVASGG